MTQRESGRIGADRGAKRTLYRRNLDNNGLMAAIVTECRAASYRIQWAAPAREHIPAILHGYIRAYTRYEAEDGIQVIRWPSALVRDRIGDCKSTAVFIGSLAAAAGCVVRLAFIKQQGEPTFSHVYAVVDGVNCDPLLPLGLAAPNTGIRYYII